MTLKSSFLFYQGSTEGRTGSSILHTCTWQGDPGRPYRNKKVDSYLDRWRDPSGGESRTTGCPFLPGISVLGDYMLWINFFFFREDEGVRIPLMSRGPKDNNTSRPPADG